MTAKIISVVNQKGGVGKTTTAVNLSSFLAESGHKTLLVDFDPQANATSAVGVDKNAITKGVYDLLVDYNEGPNALYATAFKNLHLLPSSPELAGAEIEMSSISNRESRLKISLQSFVNKYDYIIIDCAPSLGLLTVNALVASDHALIPVQCEYFALEGIAKLVSTLELIKDNLNPSLSIAGIVLTMYDPRTSLNQLVVKDAKSYFKELVFDTIIPRNVRLAEAPSHGLPIVLYNPSSKGSYSYHQLAKEFTERVK